jgi:hypothetical protein
MTDLEQVAAQLAAAIIDQRERTTARGAAKLYYDCLAALEAAQYDRPAAARKARKSRS